MYQFRYIDNSILMRIDYGQHILQQKLSGYGYFINKA